MVTDGEGVSISFDASLPDIEQYALVAFFDGNPARQWSEKTKEVPHGRALARTCSRTRALRHSSSSSALTNGPTLDRRGKPKWCAPL